ncbi:hypothetical protein [Echinicola rosea]|nr:hypothetical protein [Echinicola rosea]
MIDDSRCGLKGCTATYTGGKLSIPLATPILIISLRVNDAESVI